MGKQILVITSANDAHVELVRLYSPGLTLIELNTDQFVELTGYVSLDRSYANICSQALHADAIWYRKPCLPGNQFQPQMPTVGEFVVQEHARALSWLPANMFADRPWVSRPELIARASNRLLQLTEARRAGFLIPATMITNSPQEAEHFCEQQKWQVVAKTLGPPVLQVAGAVKAMNARLISEGQRDQLANIKHCPTLLQRRIDVLAEYRVTVFGDHVFAFQIMRYAEAQGFCYKDDRRLGITPVRLPEDVIHQVQRVVKAFNLAFSSMDILVDNEGDHYMIDLNPNGQWAWLDENDKTGMITDFGRYLAHL